MARSKSAPKALKFPYTVRDEELIKWFKDNYSKIEFIKHVPSIDNYARSSQLESYILELQEKKPLYEQKKLLLKIWENLIGNAIVFLKSKDKREEFHDDEDYGVDKLHEFFKAFCSFESLFYGANEYYRDHVSHMFKVFLLGELIIKEALAFKINVGDDVLKENPADIKEKGIIDESEKEAMWCIISLTHDLGYGIGIIPDINAKTREMLSQFGNFNPRDLAYTFPNQPLYNYIIRFISSNVERNEENKFVNHIQSKYYLKFSGSLEKTNHGIISCIVLMRNLVYFLESDYTLDPNKPLKKDDAKHFLIRRTILRSIASHDCEDIYYLKIPDFPFLLTIFDEMQEWGRPSLSDLFEKKPELVLLINNFNEKLVDFTIQIKYSIDLDEDEKNREHLNAKKYFIRKCEKIRRILRSAVDGGARDLTLRFKLSDEIDPSTKTYEITHVKPNDVTYKIDDDVCDWQRVKNYDPI